MDATEDELAAERAAAKTTTVLEWNADRLVEHGGCRGDRSEALDPLPHLDPLLREKNMADLQPKRVTCSFQLFRNMWWLTELDLPRLLRNYHRASSAATKALISSSEMCFFRSAKALNCTNAYSKAGSKCG